LIELNEAVEEIKRQRHKERKDYLKENMTLKNEIEVLQSKLECTNAAEKE